MSILNRPSDGLFNILIILVRTISHLGPVPRSRLVALCAPPNAVDTQEKTNQTLNRWVELGLLEETNDAVQIAGTHQGRLKKNVLTNHSLAEVVRAVVLAEPNNVNFWESEKNKASDFTRIAAWLLAQDVYSTSLAGHGDAEKLAHEQIPNRERALANDVRWPSFKSWGQFLGFGYSRSTFIIDPTNAVRDSLPLFDSSTRELAADDFVEELASHLPVVDRGRYRNQVESELELSKWRAPKATEVSSSLSRALIRLEESGDLILEDKSDAKSLTLLGRGEKPLRSFSHVVWKGGAN